MLKALSLKTCSLPGTLIDVSCSDDDVVEIAWVLVHQDHFQNPDTTVDFLCDSAQPLSIL